MALNIKEFLRVNGLRQMDLANYLGISNAAVSHMCKGYINPSPENLEKIVNNDQGWDTTPLTASPMVSVSTSGESTAKVSIGNNNTISYSAEVEVLKAEVKMLREMLEQKEGEIEFLRSLLKGDK